MGRDDRETLDTLISEHHAPMLRLATRLTGRLETAEEVVQEAMLRIARSWNGFRSEADFKTWATRIILNAFRDWLSKQRKSSPLEDVPDARYADPPACAMAEELGRHIAERVSALPPRQREVMILMTYEGLSADEAARVLDIQVANVYATLYEARQRLRVELAPFLAENCHDQRS
jgi:RNA polymerase sigma-70 factor (ECF subfamily)